ncbi:MAG: hypothetical protein CMJ31_10960 [Phycisphaerae bacterium]|nr:hypothetical protein [Phycisphaerae bacterium]
MSDPMQNLNDAADALNQGAARAAGFYDDADAEIATRQAAYDALAANLRAVVGVEMNFLAYVDPDEANPTNVDGGTFTSISAAVDAAPRGALVNIYLAPGKEHVLSHYVYVRHRRLTFLKNGAGANPVIRHAVVANATHNSLYGFTMSDGGAVRAGSIDFVLDDKADAGLPWSNNKTAFAYANAGRTEVELVSCKVTGNAEQGITSAYTGNQVRIGMWSTTLDGPFNAVVSVTSGLASISHGAVTLLNGAALNDGGTLGTNLLKTS